MDGTRMNVKKVIGLSSRPREPQRVAASEVVMKDYSKCGLIYKTLHYYLLYHICCKIQISLLQLCS